jgi:hypothetical protein
LKAILPKPYYQLIESYLDGRKFRIKHEDAYLQLKNIEAGVPQGSVLGSILYLLYINDVPETPSGTIAIYADDTAIIAIGHTIEVSTGELQRAADRIVSWTRKWRIKLNEEK